MSVDCTITNRLTVTETLGTNTDFLNSAGTTVLVDGLNSNLTAQGSTSTPPCTKVAYDRLAMTAGAVTLDLTAAVGTNGVAINGSGLRVQYARFACPTGNANSITIAIGASNGYDGFGADFSITLVPGASASFNLLDAGSDISGTKKTIDITGTLLQEVDYIIVMG